MSNSNPDSRNELGDKQREELFALAKKAASMTYSPYSKFPVGAAILTKDDQIILGANVENSSYGLTICAERVAICKAVCDGKRSFKAIVVFAPNSDGLCWPCGACRQFIYEFGPNTVIYSVDKSNKYEKVMIKDLLPKGFMLNGS